MKNGVFRHFGFVRIYSSGFSEGATLLFYYRLLLVGYLEIEGRSVQRLHLYGTNGGIPQSGQDMFLNILIGISAIQPFQQVFAAVKVFHVIQNHQYFFTVGNGIIIFDHPA